MQAQYVPTKHTPVTPDALRVALKERLAARGVAASEHALTVLIAMSAHETGEWRSCWNYNLGNVKAGPAYVGQYMCLNNVWEVLNGVTRWFSPRGEIRGKNGPLIGQEYPVPPGHPQTRFRAYATLADGVDSWAAKMATSYRRSLDVLLTGGSSDAFLASLKAQRYFTGDLVKYQASVRSYMRKFSAPTRPDLSTVAGVQQALTLLGYSPGKVDGVEGAKTKAAVISFQTAHGLKPDGVVGPITRAALEKALSKS